VRPRANDTYIAVWLPSPQPNDVSNEMVSQRDDIGGLPPQQDGVLPEAPHVPAVTHPIEVLPPHAFQEPAKCGVPFPALTEGPTVDSPPHAVAEAANGGFPTPALAAGPAKGSSPRIIMETANSGAPPSTLAGGPVKVSQRWQTAPLRFRRPTPSRRTPKTVVPSARLPAATCIEVLPAIITSLHTVVEGKLLAITPNLPVTL
jgi:hypothetical protein